MTDESIRLAVPAISVGSLYKSNHCGDFIITFYKSCEKVGLYFLNTGYECISQASNIRRGQVSDKTCKRKIYKDKKNVIDFDYLHECFEYIEETGSLIWKDRPLSHFKGIGFMSHFNKRYCGKIAGNHSERGYVFINLCNKINRAHRIIWMMNYGEYPENEIDHINGDGLDNRLSNLRDVTHSDNMRNMKRPSDNKSGVIGVGWVESKGKWVAQIKDYRGKSSFIGYFNTLDGAAKARKKAENEMSYHENHGR